jgi:hypothetical protein
LVSNGVGLQVLGSNLYSSKNNDVGTIVSGIKRIGTIASDWGLQLGITVE